MQITGKTSRGELVLKYELIGDDILVTLTGGNAHIGAVSVGHFDHSGGHASSSVITLPSHRDDEIALKAARNISSYLHRNCTFIVGINFKDITTEEIEEIIDRSDRLTEELIDSLRGKL